MDNLWAPWRKEYIEQIGKEQGCFLCQELEKKDSAENLILYRGKHSFIILNRYPYSNGHVMVAPLRHTGNFEKLKGKELQEICILSQKLIAVLKKVYNPQGFNLGINLGRCAGAGLVDHIHQHIVPRWEGDTNYMLVTGKTKVIPEDLEESYKQIKKALNL